MKYCTNCGQQLDDEMLFCTACGKKCEPIEEAEPVVVHPVVEPVKAPPVEEVVERATVEEAAEPTPVLTVPEEPVAEEVPVVEEAPIVEEPPAPVVVPVPPVEAEIPAPQQTWQPPIPANIGNPTMAKEKKPKKKMKKGKKVLLISLAVLLVLIAVAGVLVFRWYTSAEQRALRAVKQGDYEAVLGIIEENGQITESQKLADQLLSRISQIKTDFVDRTIEYPDAQSELDEIMWLNVRGVADELRSTREYIEELHISRRYFYAAESAFSAGNYFDAITFYRLVSETDADYETAQKNLAEAYDAYREDVLKKAAEYADTALYANAISLLRDALTVLPNDARIEEQIRTYEQDQANQEKADALNTAAGYASQGDYLSAWKSLESAATESGADVDIVKAYNDYIEQYVAQVLSAADAQMGQENYDGAIAALDAALQELPGNEKLTAKLDAVNAVKPVLLSSLTPLNGGWTWNEGIPKDPFGNDYSSAHNFVIYEGNWGSSMYAEYRLYGGYNSITGSLAPYTSISEYGACYIQIYADDVLVYTSPEIGRKTDAFPFAVSVQGAEYVKVVLYMTEGGYGNWTGLIMSDVQLWP